MVLRPKSGSLCHHRTPHFPSSLTEPHDGSQALRLRFDAVRSEMDGGTQEEWILGSGALKPEIFRGFHPSTVRLPSILPAHWHPAANGE